MSTTQVLPPRRALLISLVIASGMCMYAAVLSTCRVAHADTVAAVSPASATTPVLTALPDATQQPLAFAEAVRALWSTSWGLAIAVGVVGLLELAALAGKKYPKVAYLAWLGRGRISVVIGASTGVLSTAIAAFATGGWLAFLTSIGGGLLAVWHQAGVDPAKS